MGLEEESSNELPFKKLGEFRVEREIGRGASGTVFAAVQESLNRSVAVKVLSSAFGLEPKTVQRFHREAEALAQIHHRNIVPIYHVGRDKGVYFYAMELVDGEDIQTAMRGREFTPDEAATLARDVADALECAHAAGIIHRDVKPANLIVDARDQVRITDFGLAKMEQGGTITESGTLVGTPMYMSPEQALGSRSKIGPPSDIYSLGATLYEMLTGQPIFESDNFQAILRMIVDDEPVAPRKIRIGIPKDLETITLKCLHKDPARRYASARELAADLDRFLRRDPVQARRSSFVERGLHKVRRHRGYLYATVPVVVVLLGVIAYLVFTGGESRDSQYMFHVQEGRIESLSLNHEAAIEHFDRAIATQPRRPEGYLWKGQSLAELGRPDDALLAYASCLGVAPENVDVRLARAQLYLEQQDYERSDEDLEEVLRMEAAHPLALARSARILYYYHAKREGGATARVEAVRRAESVVDNPESPPEARIEALRIVALNYLDDPDLTTDHLGQAQIALEEAQTLDPVDPETGDLLRGVLRLRQSQGIQRANMRELLVWFNPLSDASEGLGRLDSDVKRQLDTVQSALEVAGSGARAGAKRGIDLVRSLAGVGSGSTLEDLNARVAADPSDCGALLERGSLFESDENYDGALDDYRAAAAACESSPEPFFRLASFHAMDTPHRDLEVATDYAMQAVARGPRENDHLSLLLELFRRRDQGVEAREFFQQFFSTYASHAFRSQIEKELAEF